MLPDADHTIAISASDETPFAYGEGTVMRLQTQSFDVAGDDLGTMMAKPPALTVTTAQEPAASEDEPLVRMERKLDLALRQIERLQQRIESLDLTLARTISR